MTVRQLRREMDVPEFIGWIAFRQHKDGRQSQQTEKQRLLAEMKKRKVHGKPR